MDNVINFRNEKPKPKPEQGSHGPEISEYTLTIGGDDYRVRRAADRETQGCFVTISDHAGKPVLVFSSTFPSDHIAQLIVAWRAGHKQGLARGRREGISIIPDDGS